MLAAQREAPLSKAAFVAIPFLLVAPLAFPQAPAPAPAAEKKAEDETVIRLRPNDPTLNDWKKLRDTSKDPKREPGPIHVNRQWASGWLGIPTFLGMPVALNPEDLKAGKVDVALMGAPLDSGSGMKGAAFGPRAFRTSEKYLSSGPQDTDPHMHTLVNWNADLNVVDYGDAPVDYLSAERSMQPIREMVRDIARTGTVPFVIGGDHCLEYPNVAGVADVYGKENVGVIHFDSHYDAGKGNSGHMISHGQPIRRLIEEGHVLGKNYLQVGLRGYWPGEDGFKFMREQGFRYHTMAEVERDGWPAVMKRVLAEANDGPKYLYISLDIDVLDPAYAPGTGTPEPGGLTTRELFPIIRGLCAEKNLVGFDLVELNPLVDPGYTTALNANRLVQECLTGIAMRKKGLTDPSYLSPITVEHGRKKPN